MRFGIQLRFMHETVDTLLLLNALVVVRDDRNQEVEHDNQHQEGLCEPAHPDEHDVDRAEDARVFLQQLVVCWCRELTDRGTERL
jgi:hypothetical protein